MAILGQLPIRSYFFFDYDPTRVYQIVGYEGAFNIYQNSYIKEGHEWIEWHTRTSHKAQIDATVTEVRPIILMVPYQ